MLIHVYSRFDAFLGTIGRDELLNFTHSDELNGEDSVTIETTFHLYEGYRLVWSDLRGIVHEHICQDPKALHEGGMIVYSDTALNSICELFGDYIEDKRPKNQTFSKCLETALAPTRWSVGTVTQTGTIAGTLMMYHTSAREAVQSILECGGELETAITFTKDGVTKRAINILAQRGVSVSATHKRFCYSKDIQNVSRTEHYGAITACYGYGKGVETDSGGYGRKLTFGSINNNKNYVEDATALKKYGRPNGSGGYAHVFGTYENSECEDAKQLLQETKDYLASHNTPGVTYEAEVVDLMQFGRNWEGVGVGDYVQLVDKEFSPELRCSGRVSKLETNMLTGAQTVTLGNVTENLADLFYNQQKTLANLSRRSNDWDNAAYTPAAYLQQIIDGLNEQFNTQGMSYCYTSFETGSIWASVPLDKNGKPTKSGGSAIQICSQGFRIASGTKSDGSWDWRSFGTGKGFTADEINAGVIKGGSSYWNLGTGELKFSQGSISTRSGSWDLNTGKIILNKGSITSPSSSWDLDSGIVNFAKGKIQNANGTSVWDLTNNTFKTTDMTAENMTATNSTFNSCTSNSMTATDFHGSGYFESGGFTKKVHMSGGDLYLTYLAGTTLNSLSFKPTANGVDIQSAGTISITANKVTLNGKEIKGE